MKQIWISDSKFRFFFHPFAFTLHPFSCYQNFQLGDAAGCSGQVARGSSPS